METGSLHDNVGPGDQTWDFSLGKECLYLLKHLANSFFFLYFKTHFVN